MNVQIVVRVDGRDVAQIVESVETLDALDLEEYVERIKHRAVRAMLEVGLCSQLAHRHRSDVVH